jgi:hypothetical protein
MWKKGIGEEVEVSGRWGRSLRTERVVVSAEDWKGFDSNYQSRESSGHFGLCEG